MVVIFTQRDLYQKSRNKDIFELTGEDIKKDNTNTNIDTALFIGKRKRVAKFLIENKKQPIKRVMTPEGAIAHLIRELMHVQEIDINYSELILKHAISLTPKEITELITELEKIAFERS